jgi:hypothetical protein
MKQVTCCFNISQCCRTKIHLITWEQHCVHIFILMKLCICTNTKMADNKNLDQSSRIPKQNVSPILPECEASVQLLGCHVT